MLRSAKPVSFINGVGLLLAASSRGDASLAQAELIRSYYDALARAPVVTLAAIRGNCFGCGIELALACDYRIAEDSPATRFRMTEVTDYRFMPLFGGTQRLPALVGWEHAAELLVLGAELRAAAARSIGLVDEVAPRGRLAERVDRMLARLHARGFPKRHRTTAPPPTGAVVRGIARRIDHLPPAEQPLAQEALHLARLPWEPKYRLREGLTAELRAFRATVVSPEANHAMGFFFVRQAAKAYSIGSARYGAPRGVRAVVRAGAGARAGVRSPSLRVLAARLEPQPRRGRPITFVPSGCAGLCAIAERCDEDPLTVRAGGAVAAICAALAGGGAIEMAVSNRGSGRRIAIAFRLLEEAGFTPMVTYARQRFLSHRLLETLALGDPDALLRFGFSPVAIAAAAAHGVLGAEETALQIAAMLIHAIDGRELAHPTQADLLAHEVAGFPLSLGPLLRWIDHLGHMGRPAALRAMERAGAGLDAERVLDGRAGFYGP